MFGACCQPRVRGESPTRAENFLRCDTLTEPELYDSWHILPPHSNPLNLRRGFINNTNKPGAAATTAAATASQSSPAVKSPAPAGLRAGAAPAGDSPLEQFDEELPRRASSVLGLEVESLSNMREMVEEGEGTTADPTHTADKSHGGGGSTAGGSRRGGSEHNSNASGGSAGGASHKHFSRPTSSSQLKAVADSPEHTRQTLVLPAAPAASPTVATAAPPSAPVYLHPLALSPKDVRGPMRVVAHHRSPSQQPQDPARRKAELRTRLASYADKRQAMLQREAAAKAERRQKQEQQKQRQLAARESRLAQLQEYAARQEKERAEAEERDRQRKAALEAERAAAEAARRARQAEINRLKLVRLEEARQRKQAERESRSKKAAAAAAQKSPVSTPVVTQVVAATVPAVVTSPPPEPELSQEQPHVESPATEAHQDEARNEEESPPPPSPPQEPSDTGDAAPKSIESEPPVPEPAAPEQEPAQPASSIDGGATLKVGDDEASDMASAAPSLTVQDDTRSCSSTRPTGFRNSRKRRQAGSEYSKTLQRRETRANRRASLEQSGNAEWWMSHECRSWIEKEFASDAAVLTGADTFMASAAAGGLACKEYAGGAHSVQLSVSESLKQLHVKGSKLEEGPIVLKNLKNVFLWEEALKTTKLFGFLKSPAMSKLPASERPNLALLEYVDGAQCQKRLPLLLGNSAEAEVVAKGLKALRSFASTH